MKPTFLLAGLLALAACDGDTSSRPARDHLGVIEAPPVLASADPARETPTPRVDGKPIWSSNARHTAQENAQYHFERDGETFGAASLDAFVEKAHAFVSSPPEGAQILTRANGDRLIYDPASNTFAVATRDGAPRTMFKPDDGAAYWEKQKADLNRQARKNGGGEG